MDSSLQQNTMMRLALASSNVNTSGFNHFRNLKRVRHGIEMPSTVLLDQRLVPCSKRKTDLRNVEEFRRFGCTKFTFGVRTEAPINLVTHHDSPQQCINLAKDSVHQILREALDTVKEKGFPGNSIIHLYLKVTGLTGDFVFNPAGDDALRMHSVTSDTEITRVIDKFARLIQSGKPAILDSSAKLTVIVYQPPPEQPWIEFLGSGWGSGSNGNASGATVSEFLENSRSVICIKNDDFSCMPRAIAIGLAYIQDPTGQSNLCKDVRRPDNPKARKYKQKTEAERICKEAGVDVKRACGRTEACMFASKFSVNINVFSLHHGDIELMFHTRELDGNPHINLHFNMTTGHYDYIANINGFLRSIRDHHRIFCEKCRQIKSKDDHICTKDKNRQPRIVNNKVVFHHYDYKLLEESSDVVSGGYIPLNKKDPSWIDTKKVWYFDVETFVQPFDRETKEPVILENDSFMLGNDLFYEPVPFTKVSLDTDKYVYKQVVNWVEIQNADGSECLTFQSIRDFSNFLRQPQMADSILIAHYGQGFDFQLLYEDMFAEDSVIQGKLESPLMNGAKIKKGFLFNGIKLVDSFNYMSTALSELPKMFDLEELEKGYFPHFFNLPKFWDYVGPIPDKGWYGFEEMSEKKMKAFVKWHNQKIAEEYIFDFKAEMQKYCHSDVTILREAFQSFRKLFYELKDVENGNALGDDPLNHVTIASLAYDGVFRRHYLEEDTIRYPSRPSRDNYSNASIQWLEYEMKKDNIFIQHARNVGEHVIPLDRGRAGYVHKKVDGYCAATNTVYEFHGCYYHGCPKCYDEDDICLLKCKPNEKDSPIVRYGNLYATTMQHEEDIVHARYNLKVMWECDFNKLCKKEQVSVDLDDPRYQPFNARDAYYGGRTNAVKLYYECSGPEKIHYIDVTSMYPTVMGLPQYWYPIGEHQVRRFDDPDFHLLPLEELFGLMRCKVRPPPNLYHPVLPCRSSAGKVVFSLDTMIGTWTHVELQKAVELGYEIMEVYEQHHFSKTSNQLFHNYIETFFKMKNKAAQDGNAGLKSVAKLCLNSFYGKFGFNIEKQHKTKIVRDAQEMWNIMNSRYTRCSTAVINEAVAISSFNPYDQYTEYAKANVYIAAYVTAYARLKLYEVLEILQEKVLYFDTDSCIYVSPTGDHIIPVSSSGELGTWASELPPDDYFTHFVSAGPKTYALKSASGNKDVCKAKGFTLSFKNSKIMNFESLKSQVLHKAMGGAFISQESEMDDDTLDPEMEQMVKRKKLVLHQNETIMRRNNFEIQVEENKGKMLNMVYDKRHILAPHEDLSTVRCIETLPFGHEDIAFWEMDLP